jgi:hypothetical protein
LCVVGGYLYLEDNLEVFGLEFLWRWEEVVWRFDGKLGEMEWMLHIRLFGEERD